MMQNIVKEIFKSQLKKVMPDENEVSETSAKKQEILSLLGKLQTKYPKTKMSYEDLFSYLK